MRNRFNVSLVVGGCLWGLAAGAQLGGIRGMALDADFEVPLPGVKVRISETGQETQTGDAGSFFFEQVEPGSYTVLFNKPGYTRFTKPEVVVTAGRLAEVDASLAGEYEEMDELVVRDIQLGGASEIGLLNLRLESSAMMDSVGADLMRQAAASDAAQALSLVPGTTVQDGKYAVVRGLPDRYVVSLLNGVRLPT
ncbi:carboxypeptidase regulatory-like domain-containing protein, partial [Pontiella sp.]|uniref:carboxypeptidase-like regulatory domain-containing protein n=1 Tax=Pontiella sp. TaxID=2837462 RepID=UPI003563F9B0